MRNSNTNFLLDDKLKLENAETLTYIEIKRIMIFSALYLCIAKESFLTSSLCFEGPYYSEHIRCGLINR